MYYVYINIAPDRKFFLEDLDQIGLQRYCAHNSNVKIYTDQGEGLSAKAAGAGFSRRVGV